MIRLLERLKRNIRSIIQARIQEGKPEFIREDIDRMLAAYRRRYPELQQKADYLEKQRAAIETRLRNEWVNKRIVAPPRDVNKMLGSHYAQVQGEVNAKLETAVRRGLSSDLKLAKFVKLVDRAFNDGIHRARTVARTARLAQNRADYLTKSIEAGATKFKYVGPASDRHFCGRHLHGVYTLDEILAMNNGQKLPVLVYMGGFNCRHRWQAIFD